MAAVVPFDTLDYARKLETAGVAAPQAEAQARVLAEALSHAVASPNDLEIVETKLLSSVSSVSAQLLAVESRLDANIGKVSISLDGMKWMFGFVAAMTVAIVVRLFAFA